MKLLPTLLTINTKTFDSVFWLFQFLRIKLDLRIQESPDPLDSAFAILSSEIYLFYFLNLVKN